MRAGWGVDGRKKLWPALLILGFTARASAQANYEGALIGGRSSLMGGTGVAAGIDSAAPLQNPSTIIGIEGTSFVFSTFFLQINQRSFDPDANGSASNAAQLERGSTHLSQTELRVLPNSTCLFFDVHKVPGQVRGHQKASICLAEPETESFSLNTSAVAELDSNRSGFQQRVLAQEFSKKVYALSWALALSKDLSLGVSPMLEEVSFNDTEAIATITADASLAEAVGSPGKNTANIAYRKASGYALSALVGARYRPSPNLALGVSLLTPSLSLGGSYRGTRSFEATRSDSEEYSQERGSAHFGYPLRLALGLAATFGRVGFEINGFFHTGRNDFASFDASRAAVGVNSGIITSAGTEPIHYQEAVQPIVNAGVGLEYKLSKKWSLLTGLLTDFSGLRPRASVGSSAIFRSQMDAVHGSVGVAWKPRAGSVLLGVRGFYGEGDMVTSSPRSLPVEQVVASQSHWGLSLVISGQLTLEMIAEADPTGLLKKAAAPSAADGPKKAP